ncbi:MAG TPA: Ig-like domain-containing protein [Longimicrobium sp.]|nr:Ig-like domain-containing protein [Longimicrobium sp.]
MLRNLSRTLLIAGAAWLAAASALSAQTGTTPVRGDVDGDGQVTVTDARIVSDYLVGRQVPAGADVAGRGDVNGDGRVTSVDAAIIRASAAGRDVSRFKVGAPVGEVPANAIAVLSCSADVQAKSVRCDSPDGPSGGARGEIIIGGQGLNVKLTSSDVVSNNSGGVIDFTFNVNVQNLTGQNLGTLDGTTPHADGVRVFFHQPPVANGGSGIIDVLVPGGSAAAPTHTYTGAGQPYYSYVAPLKADSTSEKVNWHFSMPSSVTNFKFQVFVAAEVQFPDGWVTISPPPAVGTGPYYVGYPTVPTLTISRDPAAPNSIDSLSLDSLSAFVRTRVGKVPNDSTITWSSNNAGVAATADGTTLSGKKTKFNVLADGNVTITASNTSTEGKDGSHSRSGQVNFVVRSADSTTSTISANPGIQNVGDSSQIVVQLKNSSGVDLTQSGGTVALATTGGTLSTVTNNHDGTYTAYLKSSTAGSFTVSGTLNNHTIVDTAVVTFNAGSPHHFVVEAAGGGNIANQTLNTSFNIQITAKDQFGNTATGYTGSAAITSTPPNHVSQGTTTAAFTAGVLASHTVKIDSVGGFTLTATDGSITGTSNSFQVQQAPTAVNDGPTANSSPGDPYHGSFNTQFNLAAPGIMANDTRGFPLATVSTFGGGSVTGNHAPGSSVDLGSGGSLQVNADGSLAFTPPTGFTGLFTFNYQISNAAGTSASATVTIAVGVRPSAVNDSYSTNLLGNVPINTATSTNFKVTTNDAGDAKVLAKVGETHGTATLASDGTFTFTPEIGYTGPASFTYTVTNGFGTTAAATVSLNVSGIAWFVNSAADAGNDGRYGSAFDNLNNAFPAGAGKPAANQAIFIYSGSYTGGVTLLNGQTLVGQGAAGTFSSAMGVTWPADAGPEPTVGGTRPTVASGITLGSGNTLRGFNFGNSAGAALSGTNFGTLTVSDVGINNATGQALSLNTGTLAGDFSSVQSTGGTNNVSLTSVSTGGTVTLGTSGDVLTGASSDGVLVSGGSGSFTFPANITNASAASSAVKVTGKTGGTVTFSGNLNPAGAARGISVTGNNSGTNTIVFSGTAKNISSAASAGVDLSNNTGATIQFTNGGLAVASTTGTGFSASGGGTVEVTGSGNTVSSGAAPRAVDLNGITIGANGIGFASITAAGTTTSAFRANSVNNSGGGAFTAGSLTVSSTAAGATVRGIELTSNSAPFTFTTVSVNNTGGEGIYLTGNTATVAVNGGTVGNTTSTGGDALFVSGGNAGVTIAASLTKSTAGRIANIGSRTGGTTTVSGNLSCTGSCTGINAGSNTGGTIDFSAGSKTLNTGTSAAVTLSSNTGATINFTNGGLAVTTTSGAGLNATGGGTVTVQGSNNTLSSGTGTALNVNSTTIGSSGLTFKSITASGGSNGIALSSTGSSGGLTVTGDGSTNGSGGSITNMVGADGGTAGNGVYLNSAQKISLSWMALSGSQNNGVYGTGVRGGFTMDHVRFTGLANGAGASIANHESDVQLVDIGGPVKLTNSRFDGAGYNAVRIENISGTAPTIDSLVIASDTVSTMQGSTSDVRGTAFLVSLQDGTVDARIRNNQVTAWWGNAINVIVINSATGTAKIQNNFADNTNGALAGAGGIWVAGSNMAFNISANTVRHTNGTAISVDRDKDGGGSFQGTVDGNTIGVSGDANSGSFTGTGIHVGHTGPATTTVKVSNNVLRQINGSANGAIWTESGDALAGGGSGFINVTVTGNNIQESGTTVNAAQSGILVTHGEQSGPPNDTDVGCYDVNGNTIANFNTASASNRWNLIRVNQRFGTTSRWPGYTGAATGATSQTDLATYLLARNTASNSINSNSSTGGFLNTSPAGSACTQPSM